MEFLTVNNIGYRLIRSRRRTVALKVEDAALTVFAGLRVPKKNIEAFVASKESWINKKLNFQAAQKSKFEALIRGNCYSLFGETFPLNMPIKSLKRFYINNAEKLLGEMLTDVSNGIGLSYGAFSLSDSKTKWGSCDAENKIVLNWRLVMLPEKLVKYVIIHELCHTYYHNHSKNYWIFLEKSLPDYKNLKKELKEFSALMSVCR
jgi:predicted metal-dependent hydrolase